MARYEAYELLMWHRAATMDDGFEQLMTGLTDLIGQRYSARALRLAPPDKQDRVIAAFLSLLADPDTRPMIRSAVLQVMPAFREKGAAFVDQVEPFFADDAMHENTRWAAAALLIWIDDERLFTKLDGLDPIGRKVAIWALAATIAREDGPLADKPRRRAQARQFAREALKDADDDVRFAAIECIGYGIYLSDLVAELRRGKFALHDEFKAAVQSLLAREVNPDIRSKAQTALDGLQQTRDDIEAHLIAVEDAARNENDRKTPGRTP
ncbi:MAG: hypothetical protein V3T70_03520 [Phycisphaerae bacterium]